MCSANNQEVISLDRWVKPGFWQNLHRHHNLALLEPITNSLAEFVLPLQDKSEDKLGADEIECNEHRMLGLLDAACALIELQLSKEQDPHPSNGVEPWQSFDTHLHPVDARQISQSGNRINCCFDAIFTTVHRGQMLGVYSSELASGMYELASNMFRSYKFCDMIVNQQSPAPFAVSRWKDVKGIRIRSIKIQQGATKKTVVEKKPPFLTLHWSSWISMLGLLGSRWSPRYICERSCWYFASASPLPSLDRWTLWA